MYVWFVHMYTCVIALDWIDSLIKGWVKKTKFRYLISTTFGSGQQLIFFKKQLIKPQKNNTYL